MNKLIVGNKDCSFSDVAITMAKGPGQPILFREWFTLALGLMTPELLLERLRQDLLLDKRTILSVTVELLTEWRSRMAGGAQLITLIEILQDWCGWNDMADKLHSKFKMTLNNDTCWEDLNQRTHTEILEREVEFFGGIKSFQKILGCFDPNQQTQILSKHVKGEMILKLLQPGDYILARDSLPMKPDIYIERTLASRRIVDLKILQANCPDIFIVQNIGTLKLAELAGNEHVDKSSRQAGSLTARLITFEFPEDFDMICSRAKLNSVHLLDFQNTHLVWKKTFGNLHQIQAHLAKDNLRIPETEFFEIISESREELPICIADSPGMGKSLLLANLCHQRRAQITHKIIIFVKFTDLFPNSTLENIYEDKSSPTILQRIVDKVTDNELGRNLFFQIFESHPGLIELFIDGFDEIPLSQSQIATEQLKSLAAAARGIQIVATTRLHKQEQIERALGTLSFNILPFTELNQQEFLEEFWCKKFHIPSTPSICKFARSLVSEVRSNIRSGDGDIAGIPQQCAMLAQIYENDARKYGNSKNLKREISVHVKSIHEMYERLLELRYGHVSETRVRNLVKSAHQMAALQLLFPDSLPLFPQLSEIQLSIPNILEEMNSVGLLIAKKDAFGTEVKIKFEFFHRTYAEFIAAEFIAQTVHPKLGVYGFRDFFFSNVLEVAETDGGIRYRSIECTNIGVWSIMREHPTAEECRVRWVDLARCLNLGPDHILRIRGHIETQKESVKPDERALDCLWRVLGRWSDGTRRQPLLSELVEALCSLNFHGMAEEIKSKYYRKSFHNATICFFLDNFLAEIPVTPENFLSSTRSPPPYNFHLGSCIFHDFVNLFRLISKCCLLHSKNQPSFKSHFKNVTWPDLVIEAATFSSRSLLEECCAFVEEMEEKQLREIKFKWTHFNSWELTPLHAACERGDASIFHFLFGKFEKRVSQMNGLLHLCTQSSFYRSDEVIGGKLEMMEALLRVNPAFLDEKEPQLNRTPINQVAMHLRLIEFLIENGANTESLDADGKSLLRRAARVFSSGEFHRLVELLLQKDCAGVFFLPDGLGYSQLQVALALVEMKVETIERLAPHLKSQFQTHRNSAELWGAVIGLQRKPVLKMLVRLGADPKPDFLDKSNYLHIAAQHGHVEAIEYFCSLGLKVNGRDIQKRTPLLVAMTMGRRKLDEVVMALLEGGADATAVDAHDKKALWYAQNPDSIRNLNETTLQALQIASRPKSFLQKLSSLLKL